MLTADGVWIHAAPTCPSVTLSRRHDVTVKSDVGDHRLPVLLRGVIAGNFQQVVGLLDVDGITLTSERR